MTIQSITSLKGCHEVDHLYLPRFSFKLSLYLVSVLSKLGLGPAFEFSENFSPISKQAAWELVVSRKTSS